MFEFLKNLNREQIIEKMKPLGISAACMTVVFIAGFGAGKMHSGTSMIASASKRSLNNYNINAPRAETKQSNQTATTQPNPVSQNNAQNNSIGDCPVKGSKSKLYHVQGGSFYDRTTADKCFNTEAEAQAAGYTKSSR